MDSYVGEVRLFAGTFAPRDWAFCDGSLLAISENETLFSLIGTTYGGDGETTFALPDLRGRVPLGQGHGAGLSNRTLGQSFGTETVTLLPAQMPAHSHLLLASKTEGSSPDPSNAVFASNSDNSFYTPLPNQGAQLETLDSRTVGNVGSNQSHNNIMPCTAINYIISLYGIYPSQD